MLSILYSYDTANGEIRPLPASPLLLPAIVWFLIANTLKYFSRSNRYPIPGSFNRQEYEINKMIYHKLLPKVLAGEDLSIHEHNLWHNVIPYPSWAKPGEYWSY